MGCENLYDKEWLKASLHRADIRLSKSKGQHFLLDRSVHEKMAGRLQGGERVVEIGAGLGSLTCELTKTHDEIWAVEIDERFKPEFERNMSSREGIRFVEGDFLEIDPEGLGLSAERKAEFAGNIPYHITIPIIRKLIEHRSFYTRGVLTVQKEVAGRLKADPGGKEIGPLTYYVQSFCRVDKILDIPPESFFPPPDVYSSVVYLEPYSEPIIDSEPDLVFSLIRGVFNYRRKTLRKGMRLAEEVDLEKSEIKKVLRDAGIDPMSRPEVLELEDYDRLTGRIEAIGQ